LVDWRGKLLSLGLGGSEEHHQDPFCLEHRLAPT
jgi:hypothetical protein